MDDLLANDSLPDEERYRAVAEDLRKSASELDSLLEQTSSALARLTDCLSIVLAPTVLETRVKRITLVSLTAFRAICVVVTEDGNVFNRQMDFTIPVGSDELSRIQVLLSKALCGKSLSDVERGLSFGMKRAFSDPLVRAVLDEVLSCIQEGQTGRTHQLGMSALLAQPEFSHTDAVLPLVQVLEDDTVLLHILDDLTSTDEDLSVQIGKEKTRPRASRGCPSWRAATGAERRKALSPSSGRREWIIRRLSKPCVRQARRLANRSELCGFGEPLTKVVEKGKEMAKDLYEILGVSKDASDSEIKSVSSPRTRAAPRREQSCRR